jgi:predicted signal transduction protein with EAL and GGDEF domain
VIDERSATAAADIMRYADMALYRAKNEGRNRACIYDQVMDADLSQRKLIEQELRETIDNGELKVAYQPIFNAGGDKIVGVEALSRWTHPVRGVMSPQEFIPIAEHFGLIIPLGDSCCAGLVSMAWPGRGSRWRSTSRRCNSGGSISSAWWNGRSRKPASIRRGWNWRSPRPRCSAMSTAPRVRCGG